MLALHQLFVLLISFSENQYEMFTEETKWYDIKK